MPKAYVMINCDKGFDEVTVRELRKIESVEAADIVYGVYDIAVVVNASTMDLLEDSVKKIREVEGVSSTLTMLVAKT